MATVHVSVTETVNEHTRVEIPTRAHPLKAHATSPPALLSHKYNTTAAPIASQSHRDSHTRPVSAQTRHTTSIATRIKALHTCHSFKLNWDGIV